MALWVGASRLQKSMLADAFGADGLPKGLAIAIAVVCTLIAVRAFFQSAAAAQPAPDASLRMHLRSLGVVAIGFGYILLAPLIGFLPAIALLILVTTIYYGAPPRPMVLAMAILGAIVLWLVFARMLGVSMPTGLAR